MQRVVLRHFTLVFLTLTAYFAVSSCFGLATTPHRPEIVEWRGMLLALGLRFPSLLLEAAAMAAAIAVALLAFRPGAMRTALAILGGVMAVQVGYDLVGLPALNRFEHIVASQAPVWPIRPDSSALTINDTLGTIQRLAAFAAGRVRPQDVQPNWPPKVDSSNRAFSPITDAREILRIHTVHAVQRSFEFFLPFITMGLVMGLGSWLKRHATFRPRHDGLVVRIAAAWLLPYVVTAYIGMWGQNVSFSIGARGQSLAWLFLPLIPALVVATLGWRSAARASRAFA